MARGLQRTAVLPTHTLCHPSSSFIADSTFQQCLVLLPWGGNAGLFFAAVLNVNLDVILTSQLAMKKEEQKREITFPLCISHCLKLMHYFLFSNRGKFSSPPHHPPSSSLDTGVLCFQALTFLQALVAAAFVLHFLQPLNTKSQKHYANER